jgi:hypothetical protein
MRTIGEYKQHPKQSAIWRSGLPCLKTSELFEEIVARGKCLRVSQPVTTLTFGFDRIVTRQSPLRKNGTIFEELRSSRGVDASRCVSGVHLI